MRLVVFGAPAAALRFLPRTAAGGATVAGLVLSPPEEDYFPALRAWARRSRVDVGMPPDLEADEFVDHVCERLRPDLIASIGFNRRIPKAVLACARLGAVNFHPSLLPRHRGAHPQFWALASGDAETGVTAHYMTERFDDGPIVAAERFPIDPEETLSSLGGKLAAAEERLFLRIVAAFAGGGPLPAVPQDDAAATAAPRVRDEHLTIDWRRPLAETLRLIRAGNPHYGLRATVRGRRLVIFQARGAAEGAAGGPPGEAALAAGAATIWTADGGLVPEVCHVEGFGYADGPRLAAILCADALEAAA